MSHDTELLQAAWEQRAGALPTSVTDLVARVGGTRAAAAMLGVTQRSVQRYVKSESGTGGETRRASGTQKTILGDAVRREQVAEQKERGGKATFAGMVDIYGRSGPDGSAHGSDYQGYRKGEIDLDEFEEFWDAMEDGDWQGALDALAGGDEGYLPGSEFDGLDELEF